MQQHAEAIFDQLMSVVELKTDHVVDLPRLKQFQGEILDNLQLADEIILFKLKSLYYTIPDDLNAIQVPSLQVALSGPPVLQNGNIALPLFNE